MNVLRCKNGHYFDGDEYNVCPMCDAEVAEDDNKSDSQVNGKKPKSGWLSGKKGIFGGKTKSETSEHPKKLVTDIEVSEVEADVIGDKKTEGWSKPKLEKADAETLPINPPINNENSLKDVIKKASANEDGKTTGYFMSRYESTSESSLIQSEPVVGWLVCIKGNHIGESFEVFSGKNTIGRNSDNKIVLSKDSGISREKHAYIIFDPKNTEYYLQPGDGSGLAYVNGNFVPATQKINNKDVLGLSNCELMLVSLCNEEFSWDRYIKE